MAGGFFLQGLRVEPFLRDGENPPIFSLVLRCSTSGQISLLHILTPEDEEIPPGTRSRSRWPVMALVGISLAFTE